MAIEIRPNLESLFPAGTPVCVKQVVERRGSTLVTEVVGVVETWEDLPTGSWYARGAKAGRLADVRAGAGKPKPSPGRGSARVDFGGKLWLARLRLRKLDGEVTLLVIDDFTEIARLEATRKK